MCGKENTFLGKDYITCSLLLDYCGDPDITISTDNACLKVYIDSDMSRYVGSFMTYKCDGLLDGFTSLIDYCPVKTCQSDTYWTTAKVSCGGRLLTIVLYRHVSLTQTGLQQRCPVR